LDSSSKPSIGQYNVLSGVSQVYKPSPCLFVNSFIAHLRLFYHQTRTGVLINTTYTVLQHAFY
jgi:hypothetical protein